MMLDKRSFYINGEWVQPITPNDLEVINPSNEESCAVISLGDKADVDKAVSAARTAYLSWSITPKEERISILKKIYDVYMSKYDDIAHAISLEMGAPISFAKEKQADTGKIHIETFINVLENFDFERNFENQNKDNKMIYEPIGVCALITPWNWPINQITLKVLPALAAGCTMILKPSEIAPLSGMVFAEILDEAKVPKGVFNLVNGTGEGVGRLLSGHPQIEMVSFTGSTRAGKDISKNAADTIKRVTLELGGKGANVVFSDCDEDAVKRGVRHVFDNSGQSCNAPTRMFVERKFYDTAINMAKEVADNKKVDNSNVEGNHIGPVVSKIQYDKIQDLIQSGISQGARLVSGGTDRPSNLNNGYFVKPTVFADVNSDMRIFKEEIFGPVISIIPFDNEEEAVKKSNDTSYGLTNYIQTQDKEKAQRLARQLKAGMIEINGLPLSNGAPFGGIKESGNGRERGEMGIEEFLELKAISGWN